MKTEVSDHLIERMKLGLAAFAAAYDAAIKAGHDEQFAREAGDRAVAAMHKEMKQ